MANLFGDDDDGGGGLYGTIKMECNFEEDGSDGGGRHIEEIEVQPLDDIGGGDSTLQGLDTRMRSLEEQMSVSIDSESLLHQVFTKCNQLEKLLKVIKKNVDQVNVRLEDFEGLALRVSVSDQTKGKEGQDKEPTPSSATTRKVLPKSKGKNTRSYRRKKQPQPKRRKFSEECEDDIDSEESNDDGTWEPNQEQIYDEPDQESSTVAEAELGDQQGTLSRAPLSPLPVSRREQSEKVSMHMHACKICKSPSVEFTNEEDLAVHYTNQHPTMRLTGTTCTTATRRLPRKSQSTKLVKTKAKAQVRVDQSSHPCQCPKCPTFFVDPSQLKKHLDSQHRLSPPYKCQFCDEVFKLKNDTRTHQRRVHGQISDDMRMPSDDKKDYYRLKGLIPCPEGCGAAFVTKQGFRIHRLKHSGERPFGCSHCYKRFFRLAVMKRHEMLHTGKPHVCDKCGWAFTRQSRLKIHLLNHEQGKARTIQWAGSRFQSRDQELRRQSQGPSASAPDPPIV